MNIKNWLDLSRKLVTRYDMRFTVDWIAQFIAKLFRGLVGFGISHSYRYPAPFVLTPSGSNLSLNVGPGGAYDPTGQFVEMAADDDVVLVPNAGDVVWGLVVIRFLYAGNTPIPKPSDPIVTVFENLEDSYELAFIPGTPGVLSYPAKGSADVVLVGVKIPAACATADAAEYDYSVSEISGQASDIYDTRLLPFRANSKTLGIQPAQTYGAFGPKKFMYLGVNRPSIFPKSAGNLFNKKPTFLNVETGAITGGDELSVPLTPVIPAAGKAIILVVSVKPDDTLDFGYGTQGTLAECQASIESQLIGLGAGNLPACKPYFVDSYVIVQSADGSTVSDISVYDARAFGPAATITVLKCDTEADGLTGMITNKKWRLSQVPVNADSVMAVLDGRVLDREDWTLDFRDLELNEAKDVAQSIAVFYMVNAAGSFSIVNGVNQGNAGAVMKQENTATGLVKIDATHIQLSQYPVDDDSIFVKLGRQLLEPGDWTRSGKIIELNEPMDDGQDPSVAYLINTAIGSGVVPAAIPYYRTITAGDITAKGFALPSTPAIPENTLLDIPSGAPQIYGEDFVVSAGFLSWDGLGIDGIIAAGMKVRVLITS